MTPEQPRMPDKRPLGQTGLETAPLILGGHVFGWRADEAASHRILDAFVDRGFNVIDTADIYGRYWMGVAGLSESIIGRWLKNSGKRDRVAIATKVGGPMAPEVKGLSRRHILASAEGSLKRLQLDRIDLYQAHFDDPDTPQEETQEAFAQLLREGKVRAIGASNFGDERLAGALAASRRLGLPGYQTFQPVYNLCERAAFEKKAERLCRENGLAVIPYSPLAGGFLSGKYRDKADLAKSPRSAEAKKYLNEGGRRILEALDEVASGLGTEPAQVALAWVLSRPFVAAAITSATSLGQLDRLFAATQIRLDPAALSRLDAASGPPW